MEWNRLLCADRLRDPNARAEDGRSPFQRDLDRITFSAAFRRLAHKTQVHPLSPNDHVHTRLTHSIEVASVGRSLGTMAGNKVGRKHTLEFLPDHLGYAVQAACLAQDIGNPPFGHSGEEAIREWFNGTREQKVPPIQMINEGRREDFQKFDGNAQGFRILTQLENEKWDGGLCLTFAVLGALTKYPISSNILARDEYVGNKFGFFETEEGYFSEIASRLGLVRRNQGMPYWCRHPLAFLVEAADDICYAIIDIEDGFELGYLTFEEAKDILRPMAPDAQLTSSMAPGEKIGKLRAIAIGNLIDECVSVFTENERELLTGSFQSSLIKLTKYKDNFEAAKKRGREKVYNAERTIKLEIAGRQVIAGLLEIFWEVFLALRDAEFDSGKLKGRAQKLSQLMGRSLRPVASTYDASFCVTDFVSGMTDRYALELYRTLTGISAQGFS